MRHAHVEVEQAVAAWFATHHGIIDRHQALCLGLTERQIDFRVRCGAWDRLHRGVYHLRAAPLDEFATLRAALLVAGPAAVVSHRSAAWLWGICDDPPNTPTVTVPRTRAVRTPGIRAVRSRHPVRPVTRHGLPCSDPVRTLIDCASTAPEEIDDLVDQALARRVVRMDALVTSATQLRHHRGRALLAERLRQRGVTGSPSPSVLESRTARLFRRHHLPAPKAEVEWGPNQRYRLDFAYPKLRLAIEVDGWAAHFSPEKQRRDHRRSNALSRAGWTVLHYDWWEVTYEPERVANEIAATYMALAA